jgi:hypothetical protein
MKITNIHVSLIYQHIYHHFIIYNCHSFYLFLLLHDKENVKIMMTNNSSLYQRNEPPNWKNETASVAKMKYWCYAKRTFLSISWRQQVTLDDIWWWYPLCTKTICLIASWIIIGDSLKWVEKCRHTLEHYRGSWTSSLWPFSWILYAWRRKNKFYVYIYSLYNSTKSLAMTQREKANCIP